MVPLDGQVIIVDLGPQLSMKGRSGTARGTATRRYLLMISYENELRGLLSERGKDMAF